MFSSSRNIMTNCCRICLSKKAPKDVSELQCDKDIPEVDKNHQNQDIMLFCLDIRVSECPQVSKSLCNKCYKKVISFYIFKVQAIKNYAYLRSQQTTEQDKDNYIQDHKFLLKAEKTEETYQTTEQDKDTNMHNHNFLLKAEETEEPEIKIEANYDIFYDQTDQLSLNNDLNYLNIKVEDTHDTEKCESDNDILSDLKRKHRKIIQNSLSEKKCKTEENCKISSNSSMKGPPKKRGAKKKLKTNQGVIQQKCKQCGKSFTNLKEHMNQHKNAADSKIYQCKNCPKIFYSNRARSRHDNRNHSNPMIKKKCPLCDKDYTDLNSHILIVHNKEKLQFVCTVCDRRCLNQSSLNCHLETHTKNKPFQCDKCNKMFRTKSEVAIHIRNVHERERPHMCHLCSKSYFKKHSLYVHIRLHTKEFPYTCDDCGKGFRVWSTLKNHRVRHGEKKFACTVCHKKFYDKKALSVHMISHTTEKPYACSFCGMKFGRADNRNTHEFKAHGHKYVTVRGRDRLL